MADERVFKVTINGIEESYKNAKRLVDVLNLMSDASINVASQTDKATASNKNSDKISKEKTKALTDEEKAQAKLAETLAKAKKPLSELEKAQELANQQLRERAKQLKLTVQEENAVENSITSLRIELAKLNDEWKNTDIDTAEYKDLETQVESLNSKIKGLENSTGDFRRNVGNYPQEIEGLNSSFEKLGEGINKTSEDTKGMVSLFQAGVGIALIFDDKNSELAKTFNNLGKIMAVVGALQQANNILFTKGAIATKTAALMSGIYTLQEKARATAIALSTKGTIAATVAQAAFNFVANLNPYVILAVALITVIGALAAFAIGSENAAEKQKELNDVINHSIDLKEQYLSVLKQRSDANIADMQRELDLLKARGASEAQLAQKQRQINEERLKYAKINSANHEKEIRDIDENFNKIQRYNAELRKRDDDLRAGIMKNNSAFKTRNEELERNLATATRLYNLGMQALELEKNATIELDKSNADTDKRGLELGKKNALALAEYRVLIAQKGSKEELTAQIAVANQKLRNDLNNADITKGERLKRTEETMLEIQKLESNFQKAQIQDSIALINAHLSLVKKGTLEEYTLQAASLELQKKLDLENTELSAKQKLQIENKYLADLKTLTDGYVELRSENEINANIATISARLASVKAGSDDEYNLRVELAEATARLAKEEVANSIENEELKAAKIKEINAKLQKDISDLSANKEVSNISKQAQKETLAITKDLEDREITRQEYEDRLLAISIKAAQKEIDTRKKYGQDTTELEIQLSEMRIEQAESETEKRINAITKIEQAANKALDYIGSVFDSFSSIIQMELDDANAKFDAISEKYDEVVEKREESDSKIQELEEQAKNARGGRLLILQQQINDEMQANTQLANQEKDLAKAKEKQEKEIAKKEKEQRRIDIIQNIAQAVTSTSLGVMKAIQASPLTLGLPWSAIIAATGALQVGVMTAQLSKLEDGGLLNGKRHAQGGMRVEGTNIEVEGGEYVINRESTSKNLGLIRYINSNRKELTPDDVGSYLGAARYEPSFRRMLETGGQIPNAIINNSIDYGLLASAISSSMSEIKIEPKVSVTDINAAQRDVARVGDWTNL